MNKSIKLLIGLVLWLSCLSSSQAQNLVNDDFEDGIRTEFNPPKSLAYWASQDAFSLVEEDGALILDSRDNNRMFIAPVTEPGRFVELKDGQTLSLEFDFRLLGGNQESGRQLRVVWFSSSLKPGDYQVCDYDFFTQESYQYADFRGYQAAVSTWTPDSTNPIVLMKRSRQGGLTFDMNPERSAYEHLGAGGSGALSPGALNTMQLNVRRVGNTAEVTAIIVGGSERGERRSDFYFQASDYSNPIFRFDRLAIGLNAAENTVDEIRIENLRVFVLD